MSQRMDLSNLDKAARWDSLIDRVRGHKGSRVLTDYEREFVDDILSRNDNDRPIWNPSVKQYNFLHQIVESIR